MNFYSLKRLRVSLSLFLIIITFFTTIHFLLYKNGDKTNRIISQTSKLPGISRSVNYFEHRFVEYKDYSTSYIPTATEINTMDMIYE